MAGAAGSDPAAPTWRAARLAGLTAVTRAVTSARRFNDVVELTAEEASAALHAATVSISRWDRERGVIQVLINVGDLGPHEERFPRDECYQLADYPKLARVLREGRPHFDALGSPDIDPAEAGLLQQLGKGSCVAVPIVVAGRMWGELYATRHMSQPPFQPSDESFVQAVAAQVSFGLEQADYLAHVAALAFQDPLTGLANRRAVDERLEQAFSTGADVTLLVCDVNRLKAINDQYGHAVGDVAIRRVADALRAATALMPASMVGRTGGDEFCVVLDSPHVEAAVRVADETARSLQGYGEPPLSVSSGVASTSTGARSASALFGMADAAQYTAKRGAGRIVVADVIGEDLLQAPAPVPGQRRRRRDAAHLDLAPLLTAILALLDGPHAAAAVPARVSAVAERAAEALDAARWAVSCLPDPGAPLETLAIVSRRDDESGGGVPRIRVADPSGLYDLADYPVTRRVLARNHALVISADADDAEQASEVRLLHRLGVDAVLLAGASSPTGGYLLELFGDDLTARLEDAVPALRLLLLAAANPGDPLPDPGWQA